MPPTIAKWSAFKWILYNTQEPLPGAWVLQTYSRIPVGSTHADSHLVKQLDRSTKTPAKRKKQQFNYANGKQFDLD